MKMTIKQCNNCKSEWMFCKGAACTYFYPYKDLICDNCLNETDKLYKYEDAELCKECLLENFEEIEE